MGFTMKVSLPGSSKLYDLMSEGECIALIDALIDHFTPDAHGDHPEQVAISLKEVDISDALDDICPACGETMELCEDLALLVDFYQCPNCGKQILL